MPPLLSRQIPAPPDLFELNITTMKIETPQILWHSNADADQGRAAPLYAVSMLPVESTATAANNTSESSAPVSRNVPGQMIRWYC